MPLMATRFELHEYQIPAVVIDPCVYFLIRDGEIVYVGQSRQLPKRIESHRSDKKFDRVLFVRVSQSVIDQVERRLIIELAPEYNGCLDRGPTGPRPEHQINRQLVGQRLREAISADDPDAEMADRKITALPILVKTRNRLLNHGVSDVASLCSMSRNDLIALPLFGMTAIRDIQQALTLYGLSLVDA